jgi:hypothetical protein
MSAMLESLLDDERRLRCRVNDAAMAAGQPIVVRRPDTRPVRRTDKLHDPVPARTGRSDAALMAADELW